MKLSHIASLFLVCCCLSLTAQQTRNNNARSIKWAGVKSIKANETDSVKFLSFADASYNKNLPYYFEKIKAEENYSYTVKLNDPIYQECSAIEETLIAPGSLATDITVSTSVTRERMQPWLCISFLPLRKNSVTGKTEKLVSFTLNISKGAAVPKLKTKNVYAANSVLATGKWYKISVNDNGVFKLTYNDLVNLGMDMNSADPRNIRIYGNGGGALPENNFEHSHDDLVENPIYVYGESDGVFDADDYILFYGSSPVQWKYDANNKRFYHLVNYYSDATYYFITADLGLGARISQQASTTTAANNFVNKFDDYAGHEKNLYNLIQSGKEWYGENLDILTSYSFNFSFPDIDISNKVSVKTALASRCSSTNSYTINANGNNDVIKLTGVNNDYIYAENGMSDFSINPSGAAINVTVTKNTEAAVGWLNFIELNAVRNLSLSGSQMLFRSVSSVSAGNISEFTLANAGANTKIWDVTDPINVKEQLFTASGNSAVFRVSTDTLREFLAFTGSSFKTPAIIGKVENQNLHALTAADFIIVTHPDFISEANRIAAIHSTNDNLTSVVVTPDKIYNEFSSGSQDVSAIRNFVKMFHDRASSDAEMPKYLLLFGDASYDYKNVLSGNTNFVPTFQSPNGVSKTESYATDDFFGFLDDNEGPYVNALLDIGIGRFPVKTLQEAQTMVDKVNHYLAKNNPNIISSGCTYSSNASGDWRNVVCFVADDEEGGSFADYSETLSTYIDTTYNNYNIDKIYCDAYVQQTGSGGQRYPDVNDAINHRVEKGAMIINYIGHGGEVGWGLERFLQVSDINSWTNIHNMPLFVTATCEFSRYDDPGRTSAGELVLLNSEGGGIALLTTSRVAYSHSNQTLNSKFFHNVFQKTNDIYPTLGELTALSKNGQSSVDTQVKNFVLLGDPALRLSYPENKIVTETVNGHIAESVIDTLKAFDKVTITGSLKNSSDQKLTDFNGVVYPTVYDKKTLTATLGNDPSSPVKNFQIQKSIIYKGKASVINGSFSFSFIVPKDIAYNYGIGRISYYAEDGKTNAGGFHENKNFVIGGSNPNAPHDNTGPDINLYLNDTSFVFGGITNEKPLLLAYASDSNGINTVGNGIGHDIVAVLDENTNKSIVLNDYYEADLNSYRSGVIKYPFDDLPDGNHTLRLKIWDIYNNSSEAYTGFVVAQSASLALNHVLNYPNPFTTHTSFYFEHNQPCCGLDVSIRIFTITGKLIKTITQNVQTNGFRAEPIEWDGLDDFGDPLARGVYIYKIKAKNPDGSLAEKTEKLVILR